MNFVLLRQHLGSRVGKVAEIIYRLLIQKDEVVVLQGTSSKVPT